MKKTASFLCAILLIGLFFGLVSSIADEYPSRPITYLIPFKPGGASTRHAERQMPLLKEALGMEITVEHMAGRGGAVAWSHLVEQPANGYLVSGLNLPHIILQPLAMGALGYETDQLLPIIIFQNTPIGIAVLKDSPFEKLEDLLNYAKENPNRLTIGGSGVWSGYHITFLQLQKMGVFKAIYIPSKGDSVALKGFLDGKVKAVFSNTETLLEHWDNIRMLALTSEEPFAAMPDVPTFKSLGYNITVTIDRGVCVRAGTPAAVVKKLESAFIGIANNPEIRAEMAAAGSIPLAIPSSEAQAYIQKKKAEWTPLVEEFQKK